MMDKLLHIGTIELVSLPDEQIYGVPAKIDTGADGSAIWASNITETDGELSFVLFDKTTPFYTGKVLRTREFKRVLIKNSFGHIERRYKTHLKITLGGRTIRASFSLANRAQHSYPILIGRRSIHGKFLVDVARKAANVDFIRDKVSGIWYCRDVNEQPQPNKGKPPIKKQAIIEEQP